MGHDNWCRRPATITPTSWPRRWRTASPRRSPRSCTRSSARRCSLKTLPVRFCRHYSARAASCTLPGSHPELQRSTFGDTTGNAPQQARGSLHLVTLTVGRIWRRTAPHQPHSMYVDDLQVWGYAPDEDLTTEDLLKVKYQVRACSLNPAPVPLHMMHTSAVRYSVHADTGCHDIHGVPSRKADKCSIARQSHRR